MSLYAVAVRLSAALLWLSCAGAHGFDYGTGEEQLWFTDFSAASCCSGWRMPSGFEHGGSGLYLQGDEEWTAVELKGLFEKGELDVADGPVAIYVALQKLNPVDDPERSKVFLELGITEEQPEGHHIRFAVRPDIERRNPGNSFYQISMDPGWKMNHEKDAFLIPPENHFADSDRSEVYRLTVRMVEERHVEVQAEYWSAECGWWLFEALPRKELTQSTWAEPSGLPIKLDVESDLGGKTSFSSIRIRFRKPGWMSVTSFAVTRVRR